MATLTLPAPAKLNLFLHIVGRRADGYHELQTLFQFIDWCDVLTFTDQPGDQISFYCQQSELNNADNLVVKAAQLLQERLEVPRGVRIDLEKYLPMGGGLGGGSSDAATTLLGLRQLWQVPICDDELATLALQLGADVPVFVRGHAAFAEGVGERLTPASPESPWYLVVHPNIHMSTAELFQHPKLVRDTQPIEMRNWHWSNTFNAFEPVVRERYPEVANAMDWLLKYAPTRLTGTGACFFARFDSQELAREALTQLPSHCTGVIARGLNESPVCQQLRQASNENLTK